LALAADAKEAVRTEGVWVSGLWITVTARRKRRLALAIHTLVSSRAQAVRILSSGVTVATLFETSTTNTGLGG
jgi:hypothetical protein